MRIRSLFLTVPRLTVAAVGIIAFSVAAATAAPASPETGKAVFKDSGCFACHGELGYGGAGPRFRNDKFLAVKDYVVGQILIGRGIMPSFAHKLSNEEIAAVATYIRNSWGNDFGPVSADEVAKARKSFEASDTNNKASSNQ